MIKWIFVDMDNTIAENVTCENVDFYDGLYLTKRPINIVIQGILNLYKDCNYIILSKADGGIQGMMEKRAWLHKYFPYAYSTLIINVNDVKSEYIASFIIQNNLDPEECLLIDDKKSILQDCARLGINVKYPQQIICDYEEMLAKQDYENQDVSNF